MSFHLVRPLVLFYECPTDGEAIGAGCIETYFVLQSLFGAKAYYAFGFLALTSVVVALTTATTTILMCYFALSAEEYRFVSILSAALDPRLQMRDADGTGGLSSQVVVVHSG